MDSYLGIFFALVRFSSFMLAAPHLNHRGTPSQAKICVAIALAIAVSPDVDIHITNIWYWAYLVIQEAVIGLALAFVVILAFGIAYFAGQLVDVPLGFGMVSLFDPQTGTPVPIFSRFYNTLATLIFLGVDGHLWLYRALLRSYRAIPLGHFFDEPAAIDTFMVLGRDIFSLGFQVALPILGATFLTDVILGIIAKTVPQIHVLVLGFPLKILVGIFVFVLAIPIYVQLVSSFFAYDGLLFRHIMALLGG